MTKRIRIDPETELGKVYFHKKWGYYTVVLVLPREPGKARKCVVEFDNGGQWVGVISSARKGFVKNWSAPSVEGVGVVFPRCSSLHPKEYALWLWMLQRCYNKKLHKRFPAYQNCEVCGRWLIFANFLRDLPSIEGYDDWVLGVKRSFDKDSKIPGNRKYAPDTVRFVTVEENSYEAMSRNREKLNNSLSKPVRNVCTGKTYTSAAEATRDPEVTDCKGTISRHCLGKTLTPRWEFIK